VRCAGSNKPGQTSYARKDVVLSAANKDGGAHINTRDANCKRFRRVSGSERIHTLTARRGHSLLSTITSECLRRFADELLMSKELLKLAD